MTDRSQLRSDVRLALAAMGDQRHRQASAALCRGVLALLDSEPMHIAGYLPIRREADLRPVLRHAIALGHSLYLPRIARRGSGHMQFLAWTGDDDDLDADACAIAAPVSGSRMCPPERLDLVLVPGTAFDTAGNRLGSGAGYYDRAFAFRQTTSAPPRLVGIAMAEQRCAALESAAWDVRMDQVLFDDQCL